MNNSNKTMKPRQKWRVSLDKIAQNKPNFQQKVEERRDSLPRLKWLRIFLTFVLTLTIIWTSTMCIMSLNLKWQLSMSYEMAIGCAVLVTLLLEFLKFKIGGLFTDAVGYGDILEHGWISGVLWSLVGILVVSSYVLSIYVSVNEASDRAKMQHEASTPFPTFEQYTSKKDAAFDAQIASARETQKAGSSIRWKGKIVEKGQKIIAQSASLIQTIENQRSQFQETAKGEYEADKAAHKLKSDMVGQSANIFGGYAEFFQILCVIILTLIRLSEDEKFSNDDEREKQSIAPNRQPQQNFSFGQNYRPQIGFKRNNEPNGIDETVITGYNSVITPQNREQYQVFVYDKIYTETQNLQAWMNKIKTKQGRRENAEEKILIRLETINRVMDDYFKTIKV
jgi:hypothetical protein